MANKDHLALLLRGVDAWNQWRQIAYEEWPDLRDVHLVGACLRMVNLSRKDLRNADLSEANMEGAILNHADLQGAILGKTNLNSADCQHTIFRGAILRAA